MKKIFILVAFYALFIGSFIDVFSTINTTANPCSASKYEILFCPNATTCTANGDSYCNKKPQKAI